MAAPFHCSAVSPPYLQVALLPFTLTWARVSSSDISLLYAFRHIPRICPESFVSWILWRLLAITFLQILREAHTLELPTPSQLEDVARTIRKPGRDFQVRASIRTAFAQCCDPITSIPIQPTQIRQPKACDPRYQAIQGFNGRLDTVV